MVRVEAPETIATVIPEPPVVEIGVGDVIGEDDPPQPNDKLSTRAIAKKICVRMLTVKQEAHHRSVSAARRSADRSRDNRFPVS